MTSHSVSAQLQRMLALHPKVIDLSLDRIRGLLSALGNPEQRTPPILHIAGTNGKGSTVALLRAILGAAGYRVHSYISPHLVRFNERISLCGAEVADARLIDALERALKANGDNPITFFEITTAAAFCLFAEEPADVLLLEVGLGGRLDATNVIAAPLASIITPISMDHLEFLGNTLPKIAYEKAGIIKPSVPVISHPQRAEVLNVLAKVAIEQGAPLYAGGLDWQAESTETGFRYTGLDGAVRDYPAPALHGAHQHGNAAAVLACLEAIRETLPVTEAAISAGLKSAHWPARLQPLLNSPLLEKLPRAAALWLDGGHNPQGGAVLAAELSRWRTAAPDKPILMIVGMGDNKDLAAYAQPLAGLVDHAYCIPIPDHKSHAPSRAAATLLANGIPATACADLDAAFTALAKSYDRSVTVVIAGSLYLAGYVLGLTPQR